MTEAQATSAGLAASAAAVPASSPACKRQRSETSPQWRRTQDLLAYPGCLANGGLPRWMLLLNAKMDGKNGMLLNTSAASHFPRCRQDSSLVPSCLLQQASCSQPIHTHPRSSRCQPHSKPPMPASPNLALEYTPHAGSPHLTMRTDPFHRFLHIPPQKESTKKGEPNDHEDQMVSWASIRSFPLSSFTRMAAIPSLLRPAAIEPVAQSAEGGHA